MISFASIACCVKMTVWIRQKMQLTLADFCGKIKAIKQETNGPLRSAGAFYLTVCIKPKF